MMTMEKLYIIDAIGPFFKANSKKTINWSKIPFAKYEKDDGLSPKTAEHILEDFVVFLEKAKEAGYNAISLDDLPHMVIFPFYTPKTKDILNRFLALYRQIFKLTQEKKMKIFINADIMFYNQEMEAWIAAGKGTAFDLLLQAVDQCLSALPIDGVIFRIGECDGMDVKGIFKSALSLKTPKQVNQLIRELLLLFEEHNKFLIFRTWTVGVFPIGDLMWNARTYDQAFQHIDSSNFIASLKYGDTDFYSGLELNSLLFHGNHQKLIELQTRREREGFGEFPFYVGWDYEGYANQLKNCNQLVGISVWCQTGGWTRWNNRTYLTHSSRWNELNTFAAVQLFRHEKSADSCILETFGHADWIRFLRLFSEYFVEILYPKEIVQTPLYFRRLRVPPCLWLFWDSVTLSPLILSFYRLIQTSPLSFAEKEIDSLCQLGKKLRIRDIDYYGDTLRILMEVRSALTEAIDKQDLKKRIKQFKKKYPDSFKFKIQSTWQASKPMGLFLRFVLRNRPAYRLIDRIWLNPPISIILRLVLTQNQKHMPKFVNRKAMNLDLIFK